ncbi:MAG: hypothetical protein Q4D14_07225 [Bacteroidales bacterium]|nr:hypothetical protein [Bacteroidales bacterium]
MKQLNKIILVCFLMLCANIGIKAGSVEPFTDATPSSSMYQTGNAVVPFSSNYQVALYNDATATPQYDGTGSWEDWDNDNHGTGNMETPISSGWYTLVGLACLAIAIRTRKVLAEK